MDQVIITKSSETYYMVWDVPEYCRKILSSLENTDFSESRKMAAVKTMPRAFRWPEITKETVEAVLLKLSQSSEEEEARLRKIYDEELACQRRVNGDDI